MAFNLVKKGIEVIAGNVLIKGFSVINVLILNTFLSISEFGIFMLVYTLVHILAQFSTLSLQNVIFKKAGEDREQASQSGYFANVLFYGIMSGLVFGLALHFCSGLVSRLFLDGQFGSIVSIQAVMLAFMPLNNLLRAWLIAYEKVRGALLAEMAEAALRSGGLFYMVITAGSMEMTSYLYGISSGLSMILGIVLGYDFLSRFTFRFSWMMQRDLIGLGSSFFISSLGVILIFNIDRYMLGLLSDAENVGYFILASTLANLFLLIHRSFAPLFKPFAAQLIQGKGYRHLQKTYFTLAQWSAALNGFVFVGINVLGLWALRFFVDVEEGILFKDLLCLLSLHALAYVCMGQSTGLLQMLGGYRQEFFNTLSFVLLNVVLNLYLIPMYGAIGAAWATLISGGIRLLVQALQIKPLTHFWVLHWEQVLLFALPTLSAWFMAYFFSHPVIHILGLGMYFVLVAYYVLYSGRVANISETSPTKVS